jgi:hypothetical protein
MPPSASIPNGLTAAGKELSVILPGSSRIATEPSPIVMPASHASQRQRGLRRWPSGNSKIRKTPVSPIAGSHSTLS